MGSALGWRVRLDDILFFLLRGEGHSKLIHCLYLWAKSQPFLGVLLLENKVKWISWHVSYKATWSWYQTWLMKLLVAKYDSWGMHVYVYRCLRTYCFGQLSLDFFDYMLVLAFVVLKSLCHCLCELHWLLKDPWTSWIWDEIIHVLGFDYFKILHFNVFLELFRCLKCEETILPLFPLALAFKT